MDMINNIPEGYVIADDDDLELYHDPLAGTIDPETGLRNATDEEVKDLANQFAELLQETADNMSDEDKTRCKEFSEKSMLCKSPEEEEALFDSIFPEYKGMFFDMFGSLTSLNLPDF